MGINWRTVHFGWFNPSKLTVQSSPIRFWAKSTILRSKWGWTNRWVGRFLTSWTVRFDPVLTTDSCTSSQYLILAKGFIPKSRVYTVILFHNFFYAELYWIKIIMNYLVIEEYHISRFSLSLWVVGASLFYGSMDWIRIQHMNNVSNRINITI